MSVVRTYGGSHSVSLGAREGARALIRVAGRVRAAGAGKGVAAQVRVIAQLGVQRRLEDVRERPE